MTKARDFYSNTVTEAIRQACADFATSQENLAIEVLETGSAGIFGLCKKRAHIRVTRKESTSQEEQPQPERTRKIAEKASPEQKKEVPIEEQPVEEPVVETKEGAEKTVSTPPRVEKKPAKAPVEKVQLEEPSEEALATIKSDLEKILELMGMGSQVAAEFDGTAVQCHITGEHEEGVIGHEGRTLDNLQYLMRKIASRTLPDKIMIDLDAGDFRERRVVELKERAVELAGLVKKDGKTQAIPALNPSERRVVHVALQDDKSIRSRSVGDGIFKKVLIFKPGKGRKSGSRRRGRQGGGSSSN